MHTPDASTIDAANGHRTPEPSPHPPAGQRHRSRWAIVLRGFSGLLIWLLVLGAIAYPLWPGRVVEILLDVSRDLVASGRVLHDGQPVANGVVHLAVEEPRSQRRVASAVVELKEGTFTAPLHLPAPAQTDPATLPLKVTAKYFGRVSGADASRRLQAETVVYVNSGPPLGPSAWWGTAVASAAIFVLISVFTSRVGVRRIRLLFMVMYLITFSSLVLPIVITMVVARNPYLVEMMKEAPIGLVNAKAPGVRDTQWLINIGGTVLPGEAGKTPGSEAAVTAGAGGAVASSALPPGSAPLPGDGGLRVSGGIAVPFYLVLLAMFGAAVNLTRRVPIIQTKAEALSLGRDMGFLEASHTLVFGDSETPSRAEHSATWAGIREDLVQNYMYLLSAPVLAIAVYYILQIVANEVSQPILVLGSFAAGLASESIVKYVMEFADNKIKYATG